MYSTGLFVSIALLLALAYSYPANALAVETAEAPITGRYIVKLKEGVDRSAQLSSFTNFASDAEITHEWNIINGFAGNFDEDTLNALRANEDVASISEDGIFRASAIQTDAPWGLARISQDGPVSGTFEDASFTYNYGDAAGAGVDIYIVDSGIRTTHTDFGGRARWGATFGGYGDADGFGHGTHCAGSAAGTRWGVAKAANLIAVKVMSDSGLGLWSDAISGMDWIAAEVASSGRPSVVNLSLGSASFPIADEAVAALVAQGVHVTVAAGNQNVDTAGWSPAREPSVLTVGSSNISDARSFDSNFGPVVDIFAPGQNIISTWYTSDTAIFRTSGTSMAAPHVAGLIAYDISVNGNASPAEVTNRLKRQGIRGALVNIPDDGTPNLLARNDV